MYKIEHHTYIPDMAYFKSMTGLDFVQEEGNEARAKGKLLSLTLKARDYLYSNKLQQTRNVMSYLIAFNNEWQQAFKDYVVAYIEAYYYSEEDFIHGSGKVPNSVIEKIEGSLLSSKLFPVSIIAEVRNSDKEW